MATAPCQLQAEVNDFTKCYSHPNLTQMEAEANNSNGPVSIEINGAEMDSRSRTSSNMSIESKTSKETGDHHDILRKQTQRSISAPNDNECYRDEEEVRKRRSASILEVREHANSRLGEELLKAQKELKLKDEQVKKFAHVQEQMSEELEELTAKLFEEANKMVQDAHVRRMQSEKLLKESNSKIEVLQAEVTALKELVITSTPSMPNRHLHPQIEAKKKEASGPMASMTSFIKGHRRSTSHHNFSKDVAKTEVQVEPPKPKDDEIQEVDPYFFELFKAWRGSSPRILDQACPFLNFIINSDIMPSMEFSNSELAQAVFRAVLNNTLTIEPDHEKNPFPRQCALTQVSRQCKYRIRLGDGSNWHVISQLARNRVTAVCDFFTYIRYITQGLVKSEDNDIYWEIIRLRKQTNLAKLGLS